MIPVREPLEQEQIAQHVRDGVFKACLEIDLEDMLGSQDVEQFNELVEQRLLKTGVLSDIGYKVVGHQTPQDASWGSILIEVTATVIS